MDVDAGTVRPVHRKADISGHGIAGRIDADSARGLAFAVRRRFKPGILQLVGYGVEIALTFLQPGVFHIGAGFPTGRVLAVAVNVVHTPVLRQRDIAALAGLTGTTRRLLLDLTHGRRGGVLRLQQRRVLFGGVCDAAHAIGIKARIVAGTFPEGQEIRLHAVAKVINHRFRVVGELADTALDVRASDGHAVDEQLRVQTTVELAELRLHTGAGCGHLVGGEQLVLREAIRVLRGGHFRFCALI